MRLTKQLLMPRAVTIPVSKLCNFEAGAILLSELAYPEPDADALRQTAQKAICYAAIMQAAENDDWAWSKQFLCPAYICRPPPRVKPTIESIKRRLNHRLAVGRMGAMLLEGPPDERKIDEIPLLELLDKSRSLDYGYRRISKNKATDEVRSDAYQGYTSNFKSRILKPSIPVFHLAIALDFYYDIDIGKNRSHLWRNILKEIMLEPHFTERMIGEAEIATDRYVSRSEVEE